MSMRAMCPRFSNPITSFLTTVGPCYALTSVDLGTPGSATLWILSEGWKFGTLSMSVHAILTSTHLTLITETIVWQWVHFDWTKCGAQA